VDSGADSSLFDAQYADLIGLDRADAAVETAVTAGGNGISILRWPSAPLEIQFGSSRFSFLGSFVDFPPGGDGVSLLGRRDFFSPHIIQFWESAELFNIDTSPDQPSGPPAGP